MKSASLLITDSETGFEIFSIPRSILHFIRKFSMVHILCFVCPTAKGLTAISYAGSPGLGQILCLCLGHQKDQDTSKAVNE